MTTMEREARLSDDGRLRWTLTRKWDDGPSVCWIMLNPSTADAEVDDPTIKSIVERSHIWGYRSLSVVNLYAVRSSNPHVAKAYAESAGRSEEFAENARYIRMEARKANVVVAAWGGAHWAQHRGQQTWHVLQAVNTDTYCIGETKTGAPKHPLARGTHRVPVRTPLQIWKP